MKNFYRIASITILSVGTAWTNFAWSADHAVLRNRFWIHRTTTTTVPPKTTTTTTVPQGTTTTTRIIATTTTSAVPTTTTTRTTTTTTLVLGACNGSPTAAPASVILPPSVPQPQTTNDIVGVNLQNTTAAVLPARVFTFAQIFKHGQVMPNNILVARINGSAVQVQLDPLATWPDGSVKLGSITLKTPIMCAGSTLPAMLSKATANDPVFANTPVSLASAPISLNVTLSFASGQYAGTQSSNLGAALKTALAASPTYWLQGPLATQARVDVPLSGGALHLTADVTAYADGSVTADVQFNNDLTTILPSSGSVNSQAALPPLQYTATINLQGTSTSRTVSQIQYTGWHVVLNSAGAPMLNVSSSTGPAINVQHDLAYLEHSGAVLPYDRTTGVTNQPTQYGSAFYSIAYVMGTTGFGTPFSSNGLERYMGQTGARPDIGYTTMWNTVWLMTQDSRAAAVALAQGDSGGAVPWNYKLANGHWLTPGDWPNIFVGERNGPQYGTDGIANIAYTNYPSNDPTAWYTDTGHQPNLAYIPYIMTGQRWYLDRLYAQAAFCEISMTPFKSSLYQASGRYAGQLTSDPSLANAADIVITPGNQLRGSAWDMREIQEAAFV
ncbi:MAG TPA: hypothetical protein VIF82_10915, partial [Burkholderiaceae bacterium]